ncbi:MAG: aminodeoxychorismate synthase component I [Chlorobiaceae bacterium]
MREPEKRERASLRRLADTLEREGSLWFESAFCKGLDAGALLFTDPVEVMTLDSHLQLKSFFQRLEARLAEGFFLAGWMSYEAGLGFEPSLASRASGEPSSGPLAWFGAYRAPEQFSEADIEALFAEEAWPEGLAHHEIEGLSFDLSPEEYASRIREIKREISAGNVYQVNFTGRYRFGFSGSAPALFRRLRGSQPHSYTACLNTRERSILSFSPELFFARRGAHIETRPMKGTARRGQTPGEDLLFRQGLLHCPKNRAENLMIVDLLRNDLGRICRPGSVEAGELFVTETYPTLHQMVSAIRGEERPGVGLYERFRALYPSGSITGAPKIRSMKLIRDLEAGSRGIYTGTAGFIAPDGDMIFNVAIRTIELSGGRGVYGTGSGIVWDSEPLEEYRECRLKARILEDASAPGFEIFESILWSYAYLWPEEHLERMAASASALGFPWRRDEARGLLGRLEEEMRQRGTRFKVKLTLSFRGEFGVSYAPAPVSPGITPLRLCVAAHRTDTSTALLFHKTTRRALYDRYYGLALQKGFDEVLFLNERDEVTEGAISNLFVRSGRRFLTPPLQSGILNGIYRNYALSSRPLFSESVLTLRDLQDADMVFVANSVRGLRPAFFGGEEIRLEGKTDGQGLTRGE